MLNATQAASLSDVPRKAGEEIVSQFGGFLRCESCRSVLSLTSERGGRYLSSGWPRCCGYTMRWWTARQLRDGEVPE